MTSSTVIDDIHAARSRMQQIASTQPSSLESFGEFISLWKSVVEWERQLKESEGGEFARPVSGFDLFWDKRSRDFRLFADYRVHSKIILTFRHARVPLGSYESTAVFTFNNVQGLRVHKIDLEESLEYPLGLTGIDNLGFYEVHNSSWCRNLSIVGTEVCKHLCVVFPDHLVECLCKTCDYVSCDSGQEEEFLARFSCD